MQAYLRFFCCRRRFPIAVLSTAWLAFLPLVASAATLTAKPEIIHFKDVVKSQRYTQQLSLRNSGGSTIVISDVYFGNHIFRLRNVQFPLRISPGKSTSLDITVTPNRSGSFRSDFSFVSKGTVKLVVRADGNAVARGIVSTAEQFNFGSVAVGARVIHPVTLINSSSTNQTLWGVRASGEDFNVTDLDCPLTIAPGHSVTFDALFAPDRVATFAGSIVVDTQGSNLDIVLGGKGSGGGQAGITPGSLNFGNVTVGESATLTGTLHAGATPITIYSASVTSSEFALNGLSFPFSIPARHSKSYQVTFLPRAKGSTSAGVRFQSSNERSVAEQRLSGDGTSKVSHSVTLSWVPKASNVAGYYVYRSTLPSGPYSRLNLAPDPNASYRDVTVMSGKTYYYVTTAVASNGSQSRFSNQVMVVIPD